MSVAFEITAQGMEVFPGIDVVFLEFFVNVVSGPAELFFIDSDGEILITAPHTW